MRVTFLGIMNDVRLEQSSKAYLPLLVTLLGIIREAKAEQPEYVTVQLNGEFVEHEDFAKIFVNDGDEIEFLYFMGGGQLV